MAISSREKFNNDFVGPAIFLGKGGAGFVIKLTQRSMNREVAVKVLTIHGNDAARMEKKVREVAILKNLHESYFPQVYDFFIANEAIAIQVYKDATCQQMETVQIMPGQAIMVMEFVRGYSLSQYLAGNRPFAEEHVIKYGRQLCEAVKILHAQTPAIIHGDIKPANIIIREGDDKICLLDFNISGESDQYGRAYTFGASRGYAAPEQYNAYNAIKHGTAQQYAMNLDEYSRWTITNGMVPINKQSDVYSIGATLYHMITGHKFDPQNQVAVDADFSDGLLFVINKSLAAYPEERYEDAAAMTSAFNDMHFKDKRYKSLCTQFNIIRIILAIIAVIGVGVIFLGISSIDEEKQDLYTEYVDMIIDAREEDDADMAQKGYRNAKDLFPERSEAYYQLLAYLYDQGEYGEVISFAEDEMPNASKLTPEDYAGEIYNIIANAYYELGLYSEAAESWEQAVNFDSENPEYYINLAVAYTQSGDISSAENILDDAHKYDIESEGISYIRGQIEYRKGNYTASEEYFRQCISSTADATRRCAAIRQCNKAIEGQMISATNRDQYYQERVTLLTSALNQVDPADKVVILQDLSQVSMDAYNEIGSGNYYSSAVDALTQIINIGWGSEQTYNNLVNTHIHANNYYEAETALAQMEAQYPDSFYAAKLGARIQLNHYINGVANPDATLFNTYYQRALTLAAQYGTSNDIELQALTEAYNDLVRRGVI